MRDVEKILVVEFGSQYSHLIVKRIRRLGVYAELVYPDEILDVVNESVKGIILSGGPLSVYDPDSPKVNMDLLLNLGIPVLGICYGHQLIAHQLGGEVVGGDVGEYGGVEFNLRNSHVLFKGIPLKSIVWMSHKDLVVKPPKQFVVLGSTRYTEVAAMANDEDKIYSVQFHPEVVHTEYGVKILENFIYEICGCKGGYNPFDIVKRFVEENIDKKGCNALIAVSGGVDSTVTAFILRRIFGDDLHLVYIDTGFTRDRDREFVYNFFRKSGFKNVHIIDRKKVFYKELMGASDPEVKRSIFSQIYFQVLNEFIHQLEEKYGEFKYLGQGTLYPDVVETGRTSKYTDKIKSHHNVAFRELSRLELIEPLKYLYKDEVREVAKSLGIPSEVYMRHPFPGPGYLVRIVGKVDMEKLRIVKEADKIVEEELKRFNIYEKIWQGFAAVLDVKTVGVKGDKRTYEYVVAIRLVESEDGMTAKHADISSDILTSIARRILDEVDGVNRVLYDLSDKPPATIEFE